jgi:hypothetical protein
VAGLINLVFSVIFPLPLFILWIMSYSGDTGIIDAFYIWSYVNSWYYITAFWLVNFMWFLAANSKNTLGTVYPDKAGDHSLNIAIS